jgi:hypothetical protein
MASPVRGEAMPAEFAHAFEEVGGRRVAAEFSNLLFGLGGAEEHHLDAARQRGVEMLHDLGRGQILILYIDRLARRIDGGDILVEHRVLAVCDIERGAPRRGAAVGVMTRAHRALHLHDRGTGGW